MTIKYPLGDDIGAVEIVHKHESPLLATINAARVSYNKEKKEVDASDTKLAKFLWEHNHTSPYRHNFYTIRIKAPLSVMRQWWKHQIGCPWQVLETPDGDPIDVQLYDVKMDTDAGTSWNEVSGRYVVLEPECYIPQRFRSNAGHANKQASSEDESWPEEKHIELRMQAIGEVNEMFNFYSNLLEAGVAKEIARGFLPQNMYSSAIWTPSLHALLNFLELRLPESAQWEIRQYAEAIKELIQPDLDALGVEL